MNFTISIKVGMDPAIMIKRNYLNKNIVPMYLIKVFDRGSHFLSPQSFIYCVYCVERKKDSRQCPDREIAQFTQSHSTCIHSLSRFIYNASGKSI